MENNMKQTAKELSNEDLLVEYATLVQKVKGKFDFRSTEYKAMLVTQEEILSRMSK